MTIVTSGIRKIVVKLVHFENDVVGHFRFSEQNIHVPRHTTGNRVNAKTYIDTLGTQELSDFVDRMLGLCNGHSVSPEQ